MKLTALFLALVGATLSYRQRSLPVDWQNPVVVDLERLLLRPPAERYEEDYDDDRELQQRFRTSNSFPSLQQYHHNENVNQYYNQYPPIIPTKVLRDREDDFYSQKRNRRPSYVRPVESSQSRFLLSNLFFPSLFYSYLSSLSSLSTTTTYLILNSTLTTTAVTSCVPINQFTTFPAGVTLTNSCRRRRDAAAALLDQLVIGNERYFDQPSYESFNEDLSLVDHLGYPVDQELLSSKEFDYSFSPSLQDLPSFARNVRSARYTITSTFTSFTFSTVNSTRTVTLASSSVLSCMPYGFKVC